ncbi:DEAD/DEAH box helicase family protein (plasmid) [Komagataeibacter intermedius]|uniref:DEAD/DEAH box helicase family protein n=1 Tax=Komagataeibacter intermedius TaxID=66229 RepID=UPI004035291B
MTDTIYAQGTKTQTDIQTALESRETAPSNKVDMVSSDVASRLLSERLDVFGTEIESFYMKDKEDRDSAPRPCLAIKAPAGTGKTRHILDLVKRLNERDSVFKSLYLVPSLDLAEQLKEIASDSGIKVRVIRGRSQVREDADPSLPEIEQPRMCQRFLEAEKLSSLSLDVKSHLCIKKKGKDNNEEKKCPYYDTCPYIKQMEKFNGLSIASHAYMSIKADWLSEDKLDLVIIDESFWQSMLRHQQFELSEFKKIDKPSRQIPLKNYQAKADMSANQIEDAWMEDTLFHHEWNGIVSKVLSYAYVEEKDYFLASDFTDAGITADIAERMYRLEYMRLDRPNITPDMSDGEIADALKDAIKQDVFSYARFWKNLSEELRVRVSNEDHKGVMHSVSMDWSGKPRILLHSHKSAKFTTIPTVVIDADLDKELTTEFLPIFRDRDDRFFELNVQMSEHVKFTQVTNTPLSKSTFSPFGDKLPLATMRKAQYARNRVFDAMKNIAIATGLTDDGRALTPEQQERKPLLCSYKAIGDYWTGQDYHSKRREQNAFNPIPGYDGRYDSLPANEDGLAFRDDPDSVPFDFAHFGNLRGKDQWKNTNCNVVLGRNEPPVSGLEDTARAVFYKSPSEIVFIDANEDGNKFLPRKPENIPTKTGGIHTVNVSYHPDRNVDRILRQIRESELTQAIGRARPIHRDRPLEIIIATNVPVPGLIPDRACTYEQFIGSRSFECLMDGLLPQESQTAHELFPETFRTSSSLQSIRKRFDLLMELMKTYQAHNLYEVAYKVMRNGKSLTRKGLVFAPEGVHTIEGRMSRVIKEEFKISDIKCAGEYVEEIAPTFKAKPEDYVLSKSQISARVEVAKGDIELKGGYTNEDIEFCVHEYNEMLDWIDDHKCPGDDFWSMFKSSRGCRFGGCDFEGVMSIDRTLEPPKYDIPVFPFQVFRDYAFEGGKLTWSSSDLDEVEMRFWLTCFKEKYSLTSEQVYMDFKRYMMSTSFENMKGRVLEDVPF